MPGPAITIPATFQTQDSLAVAAGRFADAHGMRTSLRNLNLMTARMLHPFATLVWPLCAPLTMYPMFWQECGTAVVGRVPNGFRRWRLRVYAKIEDGYSAYFQLRSHGYDGTVDQSAESGYLAAGSVNWLAYGSAWTFDCAPSSPMGGSVWVCSNSTIVVPDNKAATAGTIDSTGPGWINDSAADFSTILAGSYLYVTDDAAGTTTLGGPYLIVSGSAAGTLWFRTTTAGQRLPANGEYWQIRRGAKAEIASIQIRPEARTVL